MIDRLHARLIRRHYHDVAWPMMIMQIRFIAIRASHAH